MKSLLDRYLDRVLIYANLPAEEASGVRHELRDHLLQKIEHLIGQGTPREEATFEALRQHGSPQTIGYGLRKPFPFIDVRTRGTARGVIAIGPRAVGIFAFGGVAMGVFAFGGIGIGVFGMGGLALGLLGAMGGCAAGFLAWGGLAVGAVALGGCGIGAVAIGGQAIALWAPGGGHVVSYYTSATVPHWLQSLSVLLEIVDAADRYWMVTWPLYAFFAVGMGFAQHKEGERTRADDDWMIESS